MGFVLWFIAMAVVFWVWRHVNRGLFQDALSPLNLLLFSWIGPLCLSMLQLSGLQRAWTAETWIAVGWTTLVLVGVSAVAATRVAPGRPFVDQQLDALEAEWRSPQLFAVLAGLYAAGFVAYLYNEFITNPVGIPAIAYIRDPILARSPWHRWGKEGGTSLAGLVAGLAPLLLPSLYLASHGVRSTRIRRLVWVALAAYPTMALLKLSRIDVLTSLVALGMAEYYRRVARRKTAQVEHRRPPSRRRRLAIVAVLLALAPLSNLFLKLRSNIKVAETFFERTLDVKLNLPPVLQGLVLEAYSYFALPFENLADWLSSYSGPDLPGVGILRPVYSLLGSGRDMDQLTEMAIGYYRLWPINTYPFITLPYFEYGVLSVVLVPIFVAVLVNIFYVRMRAAPTALAVALYINCMFGWLWLFSTNGFAVLTFYLNIVSLIGVFMFARVVELASPHVRTGTHAPA